MLCWLFGSIVPSAGLTAKRTVHVKPWMFGQNLAELGQELLGAVLFVAGDQDDVLSRARSVAALVHDPGIGRAGLTCQNGHNRQRRYKVLNHGHD